jgi:RHS repeat-associated protein
MSPFWRPLAITAVALLPLPAFAAVQHPNLERGFGAGKAYVVGDIDHVNAFNGNLILTIPIGATYHVGGSLSYGLSLVYNGKAWDWFQDIGGLSRAMAPWDSNAGFAWQLHFGKLIRPEATERNDTGLWIYLSPDGGEHSFLPSLHQREASTPGVFYTRDGSYLRLKVVSPTVTTVEFPDGVKHTFEKMGKVEHWLTRMEDAFGNFMTVTYPNGATSSEWLVGDSTGRSHRFILVDKMLDQRVVKFVSKVELAGFGESKATYTFSYQSAELDRPVPHDPLTGYAKRTWFPLLINVGQPDGSAWEMPVDFYSRLENEPGISGQLVKLRLPTRGMIAWTYSRWRFPTDNVPDPDGIPQPGAFIELTPGVATRRTLTAGGSEIGKWTYTSQLLGVPGFPTFKPVTKTTTVVDPLGHRSVHYFGAFRGNGVPASNLAEAWHYGLPFSVLETDGEGRFVSKKIYAAGQETPSRVDWLRYESDLTSGGNTSGENVRVASSRSDWDGRSKKETLSDFDGLGRYRHRSLTGDYRTDAGGPGNWRNDFTNWNPGSGSYPGSFTPPATGSRWILGTFSEQWEEESWGKRTREYLFDELGFLTRERARHQVSGDRHEQDSLRVATRNAAGEIIAEDYFGGYFHQIGTGGLASLALPAAAAASFEMTYEYGQLKTRRYKDAGFYLADRSIDRNTGYPKSAKDIAGIEASYSYDTMGRQTWIKPAAGHDAWVEMRYEPAGAGAAKAYVFERPNNSPNGLLRESQGSFDDFGRLKREARNTSAGWINRDHAFDAAGNASAVSEWQSGTPSFWTNFQNYDPFGRAESIVAPDGKVLSIDYHGDWGVQRWFYVGTSRSADGTIVERQSASAEDFDILGRTWRFQELDENGSLNLDAYYRYTSGSNLAHVKVLAPNGNSQQRFFTFDARGFLTAEWHPETGEFLYSEVDARGHANRKQHLASGLDMGFSYDSYERLLKVRDRTRQADLKVWVYGTSSSAGNWSLGKVEKATHYNRRRNPFATSETWIDVPIEETFVYGGRGGRVSSRTMKLNNYYTFTQGATWGPLGELTQETYPRCNAGFACADLAAARVQSYGYDRGDLTGIPGWGSLSYHDNGMLAAANHSNGVIDAIDKDPWQMPRPRNIRIGGTAGSAELGVHSYDGGGNLVQLKPGAGARTFQDVTDPPPDFAPVSGAILESFFLYDAYGRLRTWNDRSGKSQDFDFDAFGNLIKITDFDGLHPPTSRNFAVSQTTNQLTALVAYDRRGNLTHRGLGSTTETYQWDLFDQLGAQNVPAVTHLYTADGERVWTLRFNSASRQLDETFTLRGLGNQVMTVYRHQANSLTGLDQWTWEEDYIYRGSQLLAKATSKAAPFDKVHFTLDHLGTPRVATGSHGFPVEGYHYLPFGEQHGGTMGSSERMRYTGHEKDQNASGTVDDLDYMHARYSSPNLGRFLSPDPQLGRIAAPQSWNRYSYAANNPMNFTDPTGEYVTSCAQDDADCNKNAAAFEAARQKLLESGDSKFVAAAEAYGNPGTENGVTVHFENPGSSANGKTAVDAIGLPDESMAMVATVTINPGLQGAVLLGTVAHEGAHLSNGRAFVDTIKLDKATNSFVYDISKNLTVYDLEMQAFRLTHEAHVRWGKPGGSISWPCNGCVLGKASMKSPEVDLAIQKILLNDPENYYSATKAEPGPRQFPEWK